MNEELVKSLRRWAEVAQNTFEKGDWNKCSLLHSFGDGLARDLTKAADAIEQYQPWWKRLWNTLTQ